MKKFLLVALLLIASIGVMNALPITGSGNVVRQERNLNVFKKIDVGSAFEVHISQGAKQSVVVEIDDNLMELVKTVVSDGKLKISLGGNNIKNTTRMALYITMAELTDLEASGASNIIFETPMRTGAKMEIDLSGASKLSKAEIQAGSVELDASGASKIELNVTTLNIKVEASGASKVELAGQADYQIIKASGASNINMSGLKGKDATVDASGASSITTGATSISSLNTSGASSIHQR